MVNEKWRLALALARTLIAILLVTLELYPQWSPLTTASVVYILYVVYSLFARFWEKRDLGAGDLLRLILDLILLLVCAVNPPDRTGWMVGLFYVFVLVGALLLHHLREVLVVAFVMIVFTVVVGREHAFVLGPIVVLPGALAIIAGWYKHSVQTRLSTLARQSVMFRTEAENARELERQRIAADFHDGPLQSFISFQMRLEVIKKLLARDQKMALDDLGQLQDICRKQITDMRAFVRSMRSSSDGASPATSIRQIAEDFTKTSGINLNWTVGDAFSGLEPEISHEVLQIVREALHNAQKHSKSAKVNLSAEKADGALQITIEDNGAGFPFGGAYNLEELELMRMGPESIKRRVRTLNGELVVDSTPGRRGDPTHPGPAVKRRSFLAASASLLAACGRYDDFRLPTIDRTPIAGRWSWEALPEPVIVRGAAGEWDSIDALNPSVVLHDGVYYNFYSGFDGKTWHTGLATSADGLRWSKQGRILSPESNEGTYIAANGTAFRTATEFLYYYEINGPVLRLALARSSDAKTWRREGRIILDAGPRGSWDERSVADPYIVRYGSFYYMFYLGQDRAHRQRLGLARSTDGVLWTKLRSNPILELGEPGSFDENGLGEPAVWFSHGSYWMLYTGRDRGERRRMGFARSQDGVKWEKAANPILAGEAAWNRMVLCDATVLPQPDHVRVWFGGGDAPRPAEGLNGQIGYGVLRWHTT